MFPCRSQKLSPLSVKAADCFARLPLSMIDEAHIVIDRHAIFMAVECAWSNKFVVGT